MDERPHRGDLVVHLIDWRPNKRPNKRQHDHDHVRKMFTIWQWQLLQCVSKKWTRKWFTCSLQLSFYFNIFFSCSGNEQFLNWIDGWPSQGHLHESRVSATFFKTPSRNGDAYVTAILGAANAEAKRHAVAQQIHINIINTTSHGRIKMWTSWSRANDQL